MLNDRKSTDTVVHGLSAVAGLALFLSPWLFGFAAEAAAAWSAWVLGVLIALGGIAPLIKRQSWEDWANLALGLLAFVAPWLLGFASVGPALTMHMTMGAMVAAIAAYELWRSRNRPLSAA